MKAKRPPSSRKPRGRSGTFARRFSNTGIEGTICSGRNCVSAGIKWRHFRRFSESQWLRLARRDTLQRGRPAPGAVVTIRVFSLLSRCLLHSTVPPGGRPDRAETRGDLLRPKAERFKHQIGMVTLPLRTSLALCTGTTLVARRAYRGSYVEYLPRPRRSVPGWLSGSGRPRREWRYLPPALTIMFWVITSISANGCRQMAVTIVNRTTAESRIIRSSL